MNLFDYLESSTQSTNLLKRVIPFLGKNGLAANPINYAVSYEYLRNENAELNKAIDDALKSKSKLTDELMSIWLNEYLTDNKADSLESSQSYLMTIVNKLVQTTSNAETNVGEFDQNLQQYGNDLADVSDAKSLGNIISQLVTSTQTMQASVKEMKNEVEASKAEINLLQERLDQAEVEALTDPLTGLANRNGFGKAISEALATAEETESYPSLLMLDIDHFKKVNDNFGHLVGDKVIQVVGTVLIKNIKGQDSASRFGGEEFAVLLPETSLKNATILAEKIRLLIEKTRIKRTGDKDELCRITISIGVARYQPGETINSLLERADNALYQSKNSGRNQVSVDKETAVC
ncbi:MAG: GGDEF domain-containing protein [Methylococcaceae bacterium]